MSQRLTTQQAWAVEMIADAEGKTMVDVVREAIDAHILTKRSDEAFQERLRAHIEADLALLRSLEAPQ